MGTGGADFGLGVAANRLGAIYIAGYTPDSFGGASAGITDAFLSKLDTSGDLTWTRQVGTVGDDRGTGVSTDGLGNAYITGFTHGSLGPPYAGGADAFLRKYDAAGNAVWTQQLGSPQKRYDQSFGVSADRLGNVFIAGETVGNLGGVVPEFQDGFVSKYDASGAIAWTRQIGSSGSSDDASGVSADGLGNVYVTGTTFGDLEGESAGRSDAYLRKYNSAGAVLWTKQFGTFDDDGGNDVAVDSLGNVYVTGSTEGDLGGPFAGDSDAFISKFDASGTLAWSRQLGSTTSDVGYGVSVDVLGNVYIAGSTRGTLGASTSGVFDAFVSKFDASGVHHWTEQFGTIRSDGARDISTDGFGNIYITGYTEGSLDGMSSGSRDVFVLKLHDPDAVIPEPSTLVLAGLGGVGLVACRRRWAR
jgi:hypothetical protein